MFGARTVSFHLGAAVSTIDLERELSAAEIAAAEDGSQPRRLGGPSGDIRFVSTDEAAALPLRKEPARGGTLRLIDVEGFDLSACGGTHVARTGAIGIIAVASWERFKGGQRLEFLCGGRALGRWRSMRDSLGECSPAVRAAGGDAGDDRADAGRSKEQKRAASALQTELARFLAADLAASAEPGPGGRLVLHAVDADANGLKALATAVTSAPGFVVVLVSVAAPVPVVVSRAADAALPRSRPSPGSSPRLADAAAADQSSRRRAALWAPLRPFWPARACF